MIFRVLSTFFCFIFLFGLYSKAADLYTLIDDNCRNYSGLILSVQEDSLQLLSQEGVLVGLNKSKIKAVLIYKSLQNPIHNVKITSEIESTLKNIYLSDKNQSLLIGWPVGFIENLVIIFDIEGKTHLIDLNQIIKFREAHLDPSRSLLQNKSIDLLAIGDLPIECTIPSDSRKGALPSQVLVDLIRVQEFFSSMENSFEQIKSFEERTYFYARPYLFEKHSRMGFINIQGDDQGFQNFPIYYQSSSGEPYRFQNFWKMGGGFFLESPSVSNPFSYYTEAKSHLFHGVFLGNLGALPAGSSYYNNLSGILIPDLKEKVIVSASYNYMAMMGLDYGAWSFSFGTFYPTYMINVYQQFREVLASSVSPIFRLRYMSRNLETSIVYSKTNIKKNSGVTDYDIKLNLESSDLSQMESFKMNTNLLKINFSYQLFPTLKFSESLIILNGKYSELYNKFSGSVGFQHLTNLLELAFSFGEYITVRGYMVSFMSKKKINFIDYNENSQREQNHISYGSALEFVF